VADLVEGVLKMAVIGTIDLKPNQAVLGVRSDQIEQARRMIVALVDDVRVALIKLAERTCAIRNIAHSDANQKIRLAREVFDIYSPLAHRLGIGHLKWELEDIAFRYIEPDDYKRIATLLDEKRAARQDYIRRVIDTLQDKLRLINVEAELEGRAKHIYSIWRKMRSKGIPFSEVYDVRAVRILVPTDNDCYRALGVVHNLWRSVPHEFDDYVANPKENGYRSLHTAVIGPEGKALEIQIRTQEMHQEAEFGVCSHWQYKSIDGEEKPASYENKINWLRRILEWQEEQGDITGLARELRDEVSLDRIYVFTPEGHVIDMPPGSTPVDFAYRVHTEVGHKCRGAKINGRVVPLNTALKSGDQIQVITADVADPRREWLHEHLGYIMTGRARAKIQGWFGNRTKLKNIEEGKRILFDELRHLGIERMTEQELLGYVQFDKGSDLFAAVGSGDINSIEIINKVTSLAELDERDHQLNLGLNEQDYFSETPPVSGIGDFAHEISECCKPVLGDSILGVIDDANIVHVHRQDCIQALRADSYGRLLRLDWQDNAETTFPVTVAVDAYDRSGLLHDITGVFLDEKTNVIEMTSRSDKKNNRVNINMIMEVTSLNELLRTLEKIEQIPNVISARRSILA
ncbi:MAG: bifunctional (p)ppGpp synthetase/guanosine-3',5'-bis(diphosphate) 3'-pyrophosphohydrolase, partial [Pseudomonadales bacterium]|nr:bifunctional (p)ppGpp synthetase/guanosine-3',5'-bis(diphosphate) 3'-pyrophosphohydrolase [Pseudomonadales bacterium]